MYVYATNAANAALLWKVNGIFVNNSLKLQNLPQMMNSDSIQGKSGGWKNDFVIKILKDGLPHHIYAYTFQEITLHFSSTFIAFVSTLHFSSNYICNSIKSKVYKNAI